MDVTVDREACVGSGSCVLAAPGVFSQDDSDGRVVAASGAPGPEALPALRMAAARCPVGAIVLREHDGTGESS